MYDEHSGLPGCAFQAADKFIEWDRDPAGLHQDDIHAVAFDAVKKGFGFGGLILLHREPDRQILHAGMRLIPKRPRPDNERGCQRHHTHGVAGAGAAAGAAELVGEPAGAAGAFTPGTLTVGSAFAGPVPGA